MNFVKFRARFPCFLFLVLSARIRAGFSKWLLFVQIIDLLATWSPISVIFRERKTIDRKLRQNWHRWRQSHWRVGRLCFLQRLETVWGISCSHSSHSLEVNHYICLENQRRILQNQAQINISSDDMALLVLLTHPHTFFLTLRSKPLIVRKFPKIVSFALLVERLFFALSGTFSRSGSSPLTYLGRTLQSKPN